ncbi:MAG TPA: glycosyltransferase family 2 protein [Caulobacteraceae bacterium]|nr:glycosyltransferase family 2 protein [Caulobacteraceae bacterium]
MNFDGSRGSALRAFVDFAIEDAGTPQPPPDDLRGISCIVCAYNEADRIRNILDVIVGHPTLGEVIVVNDGSTDETEALIRSYPTIRVLTHTPNRGKTYALSRGIAAARYDHLMLLDADLAGITAADIDALAAPVMRGEAEVSISLRSNSLWVYRQLGLDFVSGERVVPKWLLKSAVTAMQKLPRWGGEVFMNEIFIRQGCRIAVVRWRRVLNIRKYQKVGAWRGALAEAKMIADATRVLTPLGLITQNLRLLKQVNRRTWKSRMKGIFAQSATYWGR